MNEEIIDNGVNKGFFDKQIKAIAILGILIFTLIFLSLLSFSPSDEENAQVTVPELFKLFTGDDELEAKASVTKNWLGLAGAKISNFIYNGTIGYYSFSLPLVVIYWLIIIFLRKEITKSIIKYTIIYFIMGIFFSGFIGSLQNIEFLNSIPKEWSGSIGQFLSNILVSIIGVFGSIMIFASGMVLVIYLSSEIRQIIDSKLNLSSYNFSKIKSIFENNKFDDNNDTKIEIPTDGNQETSTINIDKSDDSTKVNNENNLLTINYGASDNVGNDVKVDFDPVNTILKSPRINIKKVKPEEENISINYNPFELNEKQKNSDSSSKESNTEFVSALDVVNQSQDLNSKDEKEMILDSNEEINQPINIKFNNEKLENIVSDESISKIVDSDDLNKKIDLLKVEKIDDKLVSKDDFIINVIKPVNNEDEGENINKVQKVIENKPATPKEVKLNIKSSYNKSLDQIYQLSTAIHDEKIIYKNPSINLLNSQSSQTNINQAELETNARILQEKLETFKIFIEDLTVTPGPVVTQYEFVPAPGIKISKIESLTDDLAMALKAKGIRIIAPIPGKGTIGVEIPNNNPSMVRFGEVINTSKFSNSNAKLPIALGKTISGEVYIADLTKMPHLLIAGSTGSGKSVGVNTIITSLLYKMHPSQLKFVIIDPKKVELRQYEGLAYHYMATSPDIEDIIVTKPEDAVVVLKSAVKEMELRYEILASAAQRNISDYNEKILNGTLKVKDDEIHRPMPYIVVIIDELADLMLTASKEIEEPITRLAQMARAVGIHLVIATQRPSVDVITGVIKANFPARMAYLVASKIDSRTILDMQGAEQLLGQGDMLFLPSGQPKPVRIQNAFISTDEVESVCEFIETQKGYSEPYYLPTLLEKSNKDMIDPEDRDELFEEAARLIIRTQQGSVSLLQRRLKIGYARAGRIVDELEAAGVVGPFDGSKARLVLMESESDLEAIL